MIFIGEQSEERYITYVLYFLKSRAYGGKLVTILESAGQIYPETCLTFETPKYALTSVVFHAISYV
jgi:hypothetical protein